MKRRHTGWVRGLGGAILSAVILMITAAQARPLPENGSAEAWASLGVDLEFTKKFLSNTRCAADEPSRLSSLAAVNSIEKRLGLPLTDESPKFCSQLETMLAHLATLGGSDLPPAMIFGLAINTHLRYFDPHAYLRPIPREGGVDRFDFTGAGLILAPSVLGFKVLDILPESPLPLRYDDQIVAVASKPNSPFVDLKGLNSVQAQRLLHGRTGTEVNLRVLRGNVTFYVTLPRAPYTLENVSVRKLPGLPQTALVRIGGFVRDKTCLTLQTQLQTLRDEGYSHLLLDLRGNFGGNVEEAICASALFVGPRAIMGVRYLRPAIPELNSTSPIFFRGSRLFWRYGNGQAIFDFKTAVLMDATTGSAAELMAGTLQIYEKAWLVGERSFGKGTLQLRNVLATPKPSRDYQLEVGATSQLFYLANFMSVQKVGLTPSFALPEKEHSLREEDLFPTSQPAENLPWTDTRPLCIAEITKTIADKKMFALAQAQLASVPPQGDDPRAYAVAVLRAADQARAVDCHR